ncbi:hypothetical protein E5D57_007450 [Metarhizium anisopliae]|nr:hypothetical protein E5D57_007450 [Metarhizium anisopliae]
MSWNMLPRQIRNDVLARVVETAYSNDEPLAGYASVSRDWQAFFEQHTFCSLDVTPGDLDMFETSFQEPGRKRCLQRVGLVLDLPQHPPIRLHNDRGTTEEETALLLMRRIWDGGPRASFYPPELSHQKTLDDMALVSGISSLFGILAAWTRHQVSSHGVALEIIADSKSYWQKMAERMRRYGGIPATPGMPVPGPWVLSSTQFPATFFSLSQYDWQGPVCAAQEDFNFELGLNHGGAPMEPTRSSATRGCRQWFPSVSVISAMSVLRRTVRRFHPDALGAIIWSLPCLRMLDWQLRPLVACKSKRPLDLDIVHVLFSLPVSLRHLHITQVHTYFLRYWRGDYEPDGVLFRILWYRLSELKSLSLEYDGHTLESYMANSTTLWPNLESLILSAKGSIGDSPTHDLNRLVRNAAYMLLRTPRLRSMVLYDTTGRGVGCFTCRFEEDTLALRFKCSWFFVPDADSMASWRDMAVALGIQNISWDSEIAGISHIIEYINGVRIRIPILMGGDEL